MRCHGTAVRIPASAENLRATSRLVAELGLAELSSSAGRCRERRSRRSSARVAALVNNTRPGAPDKVVYEACAACGR